MILRSLPYLFCIACIGLYGCDMNKKKPMAEPADQKAELFAADKKFSDLSAARGMKNAFMEYIDSNGILLRPDVMPIAGADAIDYLIALNDTGYSMTWQYQGGAVSASGDMGYTFGNYKIQPKLADTILYGTYVSIWKKNAEGKWKLILDSGNEGIGENVQ